jgi:hypothetical protein
MQNEYDKLIDSRNFSTVLKRNGVLNGPRVLLKHLFNDFVLKNDIIDDFYFIDSLINRIKIYDSQYIIICKQLMDWNFIYCNIIIKNYISINNIFSDCPNVHIWKKEYSSNINKIYYTYIDKETIHETV